MPKPSTQTKVVFVFGTENVPLDNDQVIADLSAYLERDVGAELAHAWCTMRERNARI